MAPYAVSAPGIAQRHTDKLSQHRASHTTATEMRGGPACGLSEPVASSSRTPANRRTTTTIVNSEGPVA
eukprot:1415187-Rhodomonas_salina.1